MCIRDRLFCGSVLARADMIRDAEIEAGLEQLVAPLASAAGYAPGEITVRVVINPHYNAFVAGKRAIYVHSALLLEAENVLEFLGVMAHEIGHIKAGHVPRIDEAQTAATGAAALATIAAMAIAASGSGDAAADVPEASLAEVNFPAKAFYLSVSYTHLTLPTKA